jgi:hypothetical protein
MLREWFAESPAELYDLLRTHPYCQKYGVYEYPFPASYYVDSTVLAGFRLIGVVPAGYANNCLGAYILDQGPALVGWITRGLETVVRHMPRLTVIAYRAERAASACLGLRLRWFTRPQLMVFQRSEVPS